MHQSWKEEMEWEGLRFIGGGEVSDTDNNKITFINPISNKIA